MEKPAVNLQATDALVERYVKALYRASVDCNLENEVAHDIDLLDRLLESAEITKAISKASVFKGFSREFIRAIRECFAISLCTYNFLRLLSENDKILLLKDICMRYRTFLMEKAGRKVFYIIISDTYTKSDRAGISAKIRQTFSQNAECVFINGNEKDKAFYGIRIFHNGKILDYSAQSKLSRLSSAIKE